MRSEEWGINESHPRPDFARSAWHSLDGTWEFAFDHRDKGRKEEWQKRAGFPYRIEVPFPIESSLSGIGAPTPPPIVWYLRRFDLPPSFRGRRVRLCFGAVDYHTTIWLNGRIIGVHEGGYTPFSFEVTDFVRECDNVITLRVKDERTPFQIRGKQTQRKKSWGIFYTSVTGIWQSVWLEAVGKVHLEYAHVVASADGNLAIHYSVQGLATGARIHIEIRDPLGEKVALSNGGNFPLSEDNTIEFSLPGPLLWSPTSPNLYKIKYQLYDAGGDLSDEVISYFGIRTVEIRNRMVYLNGEPFYHRFLLNQGYYPDGIYRPANEERYRQDIEDALNMGFNGVRIHQKIEDPKFLYWCDKLGLLVWAEMPSFHLPSERNHAPFLKQWREVITRDFNHPCIIVWVPFNEQWGIQDVWLSGKRRAFFEKVIKATRAMDNTRLLVDNSGWEHLDSDILDIHTYAWNEKTLKNLLALLSDPKEMCFSVRKAFFLGGKKNWPLLTKPLLAPTAHYQEQPIIVSEYGGFGYYPTQKGSLLDNFRVYTLAIANAPHIAGFCYTQQFDTEQEKNGLFTYDRKPKVNPAEIKAINNEVIRITTQRRERDSNVLPLRR